MVTYLWDSQVWPPTSGTAGYGHLPLGQPGMVCCITMAGWGLTSTACPGTAVNGVPSGCGCWVVGGTGTTWLEIMARPLSLLGRETGSCSQDAQSLRLNGKSSSACVSRAKFLF